jgi:transcription elongation factor GreA
VLGPKWHQAKARTRELPRNDKVIRDERLNHTASLPPPWSRAQKGLVYRGLSRPGTTERTTRKNVEMGVSENDGEPITEAGLAALKAEIAQLETAGRREIAARIRVARGHGDLKENGEYHAAKEDQAHLETRILRLRQRWRDAVVVDTAEGSEVGFAFGRSAEVRDERTGEVQTWTIVGAGEADRTRGRLSVQSPVGKALLDQPAGATVEVPVPGGTRRLTIERVL